MIETFKIVHGFSNVESSTWFDFMSETSTRTTRLSSEPLTIRVKYSRTEIRKNFFSTRVVNPWNNLPAELKQSRSIKLFKSSYDCYIQTQCEITIVRRWCRAVIYISSCDTRSSISIQHDRYIFTYRNWCHIILYRYNRCTCCCR